jgi:hypothetical protein
VSGRDSTKPWFDAEVVARAVALGEDRVVIHGLCFTIKRGHRYTGRASGLEYECALLRRVDGGFAPMGYVRIPDA